MKQKFKHLLCFIVPFACMVFRTYSQCTPHDLIGYWHNWNTTETPYIPLDQIDNRYTIIDVAFAVPTSPSDMNMTFAPDVVSTSTFINQVQTLKNQGKKVVISIGGANTSIDLTTSASKNAFVTSMTTIIETYGFNGIDLDIEHGNSILASGTIANPTDSASINLIAAVQTIMQNYQSTHGTKLYLSMAPETADVQGGISAYGVIWGGYLPLIDALRNELDILHVQLYNSGSMVGIDGNSYSQSTADFIISMAESVIHGFDTQGGHFQGLPGNKIAIGLPACTAAAGGGYTLPSIVKSAVDYLMGNGPKPGSYTLQQAGGYPDLRGLMTWSINWDAVGNGTTTYEYATNYATIFGTGPNLISPQLTWGNPASIQQGTALSATQLNAVANVPGTLTYSPPAGTLLTAGSHTLTVTFVPNDSCTYSSTSATVQINVTGSNNAGLQELSDQKLIFYPNPATSNVTFSITPAELRLFDIKGKELPVQSLNSSSISVENLSSGFYYLEINGSKQRLVVQH